MGWRNRQKGKLVCWDRHFNKATKEILIILLIIIIIIMNTQNKLYTIDLFSPPSDQFAASPWAAITESHKPWIFENFPKKKEFRPLNWRRLKLMGMRRADSSLPPGHPPFINWAGYLWYRIYPLASLGYLSGYAYSQHLYTCSLAEYGRLEKVFDFTATTENISVINILLTLYPKHGSYWEENYPNWNEDTEIKNKWQCLK